MEKRKKEREGGREGEAGGGTHPRDREEGKGELRRGGEDGAQSPYELEDAGDEHS